MVMNPETDAVGIILIERNRIDRKVLANRIQILTAQLRDAGVRTILYCHTHHPFHRNTRGLPVEVSRLSRKLGAVEGRPSVYVSTDQYHLSSEWVGLLLRRSLETARPSVLNEGSIGPHLGLRAQACAIPPQAARAAHSAFVSGTIDGHAPRTGLATAGLDPEFVSIDHDNVRSLYRQAVKLDVPWNFVVETNSSCNYACLMCPYHGARQREALTYVTRGTEAEMDIGLFRRVVDEIAAIERPYQNDPPVTVAPYRRGEFLLYPHWREALSYIKDKGLRAYFSTNGSKWTDDDVDFILDVGLDQLQISIEGYDKETHRQIRLNTGFEDVVSTIRRVMQGRSKRGMKAPLVQLAHTINERNYEDVLSYVDFWGDKVDALFIGPENYADEEHHNKRYKAEFSPVPSPDPSQRVPCNMLKDTIWVDAEGSCILCIGSKQSFIGDVKSHSMSELIQSPLRLQIVGDHIEGRYANDTCDSCENWVSAYGRTEDEKDYSVFLATDTQYYTSKRDLNTQW